MKGRVWHYATASSGPLLQVTQQTVLFVLCCFVYKTMPTPVLKAEILFENSGSVIMVLATRWSIRNPEHVALERVLQVHCTTYTYPLTAMH